MKVFIENQRFNQWWLYLLLAIPLLSLLIPFVLDLNKIDPLLMLLPLLFLVFVYLFIFSIQLKTRIDENGVYYQFFPINWKLKLISWDEIENCYYRKYKPIKEYGGWGYRMKFRRGKAINIRGNCGIQLVLKDGKNLLLGTQKPNEVKKVIETYKGKIIQSKPVNSI